MDSDLEVIWSAKAKITYFKVLDYLENNWPKREVIQFHRRTEIILRSIKKNPGIFPVSSEYKMIRKAIVDKTTHSSIKQTDITK